MTKLDAFERSAIRPGPLPGSRSLSLVAPGAQDGIERVRATVASYAGHLRHGKARRAWEVTWAGRPWLAVLWRRDGWRWRPRWQARDLARARTAAAAYRAVAARLDDRSLAFWPAGRFVEFYGPQHLVAERMLGLRRARLGRFGYAFTAGFPALSWGRYARRALGAGLAVLVVRRRDLSGMPHGRETVKLVRVIMRDPV